MAMKEVASEIEKMMKENFGNVDMGYGDDVVTINHPLKRFQDLPPKIFRDILMCLSNEADYTAPVKKPPAKMTVSQAKRFRRKQANANLQFGVRRREMIRSVWRMEAVCNNFANAFNLEEDRIPVPTIGLRIMPKPAKTKNLNKTVEESPKVLIYIYGDFSRHNLSHCLDPSEIADTIYPAVITTHLVVQAFRIDDGTFDMIKALDTSAVEEVYFNDIKAVELEKYTVQDLVALFPNAMEVRFLGDQSVESMKELKVEIPDMESHDFHSLKTGKLVQMYHGVDMDVYNRQRHYRNRKVFLRELKNRGVDAETQEVEDEPVRTANKRLKAMLNKDPSSPKKAKLTEEETTKLKEGMEKLLAEAPNKEVREYLKKML